ncbi:helix-turn-helix domain-containing protein [Bradyrhizobium sp. PRIMUS42]|uniref:winged helix-turn-helix transcriptional regulator n=1 Tax=Bradyrhizobium sp. PRIMUS42 TaxID=2908926 RepID=UPI001FF17D1E|nr:helix-turn-helix domain-containing protein [Bradyrhizobium sp. PRIMUS42]MCJ9728643.1 helix-turn-helix transcriptional regulator [Bradyrhizobium sp. PRIMUS42]
MMERHCSVRRTVEIVLDSWTFLVLREAFFGVRGFGELQRRLGIPRQTLTTRLAALVANEILVKDEATGEGRNGYFFTERGKDLFASMLSLMEFGDKWLTGGRAAPLKLTHTCCRSPCNPVTVCSACREPVNARDVSFRDGPGAGRSSYEVRPRSRRSSDPALLERARPCSVARTLQIIGDRWSFLIMREAWFGVRRFDEMAANLGIASNILSDRLTRLVGNGIFRKEPYRSGGDRFSYRFTEMGHDLYRPMVVMMRWGDRWLSQEGAPLRLRHRPCNSDFEALVVCSHCTQPIDANTTTYAANYALSK